MKIIIELKHCKHCQYYDKNIDLLQNIATDLIRQLKHTSVTVRANREHIRRIYLQK